jgi:hypothetical protein
MKVAQLLRPLPQPNPLLSGFLISHHLGKSMNQQIQTPENIGSPFEGGFYGGKIHIGVAIFAIVWAPKAEGEITGKWLDTYTDVPGATSCFDSMANTKAMAEAGSPIAKQALSATIGGHGDWCVPARDVLEMGYRYLKPTTEENDVYRYGDNPSSIPAGYPYTETSPAQTAVEVFQKGNAEAFEESWYFSSTQYSELTAWSQDFDYGGQNYDDKVYERRCRFVRLIQLST